MLVVVLVALTAYRVTRLLARDEFPPIALVRARIVERWGDESWQGYLATCVWCLGVWVSAAVTAVTWAVVDVPLPLLTWGAAAAATGFLGAKEG